MPTVNAGDTLAENAWPVYNLRYEKETSAIEPASTN